MYRAVTLAALNQGIDPKDDKKVAEIARQIKNRFLNLVKLNKEFSWMAKR